MFKKVMIFAMAVLSFFSLFAGVTPMQLLPILGFLFFAYMNVFQNKKNNQVIVFLCVFMLLINIAIVSYADIVAWTLCMIAFWKD